MGDAGVLTLALSGLALVVGLLTTAQPPVGDVPDLATHLRGWSQLHGGLDPVENRWVRGWLTWIHRVARPPARWGWQPDVLSVVGVWFGGVMFVASSAGGRWPLLGPPLIVLIGISDGLDGAVAVLCARATAHGRLLDVTADRVVDALLLLGFWRLEAPLWLVGVAFLAVVALEGTRALGVHGGEPGRLTAGERPTRLILAAFGFCAAGVAPEHAAATAQAATYAIFGVAGISWLVLSADLSARRRAR